MTTLFDPRTGQPRRDVIPFDSGEILDAVHVARSGFPKWAGLTPRQRGDRLDALAGEIDNAADQFVTCEIAGTGKPSKEAWNEVNAAIDVFHFFAGAARTGNAPAAGGLVPGHESWVRWEPLGVAGVIVPWNYPLLMAAWRVAPALAAGNTVVLKPAETTPDSAELLYEIAHSILGSAVLMVCPGDRYTGQALAETSVDIIAFTGSETSGADVAARAGVRPVSLELGGNCPAIVLPDAPDYTWQELAKAATYNAGQSCAAPSRVITLGATGVFRDDVADALVAATRERRAGVDFGPLNNLAQATRYDRLIDNASRHGTVHDTGMSFDDIEVNGYWRPACVVTDVGDNDAQIVTEEIFGPALTLQHADDFNQVIALANSSRQALAASIWTKDIDAALRLARHTNAGEVWINCHLVQTPELPHSGRGASGNGVDLSTTAMNTYRRPKTITAYIGG